MAFYSSFFAFLLLSFFLLSVSDPSTLHYLTKINLEKVSVNVVVDLGRESCLIYSSQGCASISGDVTVQSNNLKNGNWVSGPNVTARGISLCCETTTGVLRGLAKGAEGIAGLGRSGLSLTSQFSSAFQFPHKFALDLSSPTGGSMYFGDGPYPNQLLAYTPLITNFYFPSDYFVDVMSIEIHGGNVTYDKGMLSIDNKNGVGGAKFSTLVPYTTMERSIYKAFTSIYINRAQAMNISVVAPVWPFHACFSASTIQSRPDGLVVPNILLRLSNNVNWMIRPGNSLKLVKKDVYCLAFVDGGSKTKTSIVIGGHQMQYNIIEFDIPRSRLGFRPRIQV